MKKTLIQKAIKRSGSSFAVSCLAAIVVSLVMMISNESDFVPLVPSYRELFASDLVALNVYDLLVGLIGAAFGASSVIFELEKWSWLKQGVIHFVITTLVWLPLATLLWGLYRYPHAIVSTLISMTVTYIIIWTIQYQICKRSIQKINDRLTELDQ